MSNVQKIEPRQFPQYLAAIVATLMANAIGMCLSWTSGVTNTLIDTRGEFSLSLEQVSWIGSVLTLGGAVGAISAGNVANLFGRKRTLLATSLPLIAAWLLLGFSNKASILYFARFLQGLVAGATSVIAPMYVAEIAHSSIRGTLGTLFQMQITVGLLLEYVIGAVINDYQMISLISAGVPVIFLLGFGFMPESPAYLCSKGNVAEARKSLRWLRGPIYYIEDELSAITDNLRATETNKARFTDLISCRATWKGLIITLGLMIMQQLSGINAVLFYGAKIFSLSAIAISPSVCTIIIGAIQVVATLGSTILVDKAGRKILLFTSSFIMSICLILLGGYFYVLYETDLVLPRYLSLIPLLSLGVYIVMFSIGLGPIPWLMVAELFDSKVKGMASSITATVNWLLAFVVTKQFISMTHNLGTGVTFGLFSIVCLLGAIFVVLVIPETKGLDINMVKERLKGKSLRQINVEKQATTAV